MKRLTRASLRQRMPGYTMIDVTVKSATTRVGKLLAPTWELVMGFKNGEIKEEEYTLKYIARIRDKIDGVVNELLDIPNDALCLVCYCADGQFCHTHIVIDMLLTRFPEFFEEDMTYDKTRPKSQGD